MDANSEIIVLHADLMQIGVRAKSFSCVITSRSTSTMVLCNTYRFKQGCCCLCKCCRSDIARFFTDRFISKWLRTGEAYT